MFYLVANDRTAGDNEFCRAANTSKLDQLTNKIALFPRHAALYIYVVLQNDERNLRVVKSQLCSCFW